MGPVDGGAATSRDGKVSLGNPPVASIDTRGIQATRRLPTMASTDRIEKRILLRAPRSRVWRALTDVREFGAWFRVALEVPFAEGATVRGRITHPGYEHVTMEMGVERMDPERLFSYRWHPYAVTPDVDYSAEPTTLVEFRLEEG